MIFLAFLSSLAPTAFAAWTVNPVVAAIVIPKNSQVVVDTRPMDAVAFAPRCPTMDASIYSMIIVEICASMAGRDSLKASLISCAKVKDSPFCRRSSIFSLFSYTQSFLFNDVHVHGYDDYRPRSCGINLSGHISSATEILQV